MSTSTKTACTPDIGARKGTGYIWIAYSVFFFIEPVVRHQRLYWLECAAIYAVFVAMYISYMGPRTTRQRYLLLGGFYLLGLLTFPLNPGATSFFIYCAAFLPFAVESATKIRIILVAQCLVAAVQTLWLHGNVINVAATVFFIAVVGSANTFIAQQKRADSKLRMAHEENAQLAAVAERERIARDLHDVLGHTLSVIVLKAELARRLMQSDNHQNLERAAQEIAEVEATARTALAEVREAIGGYRSQGLAAELAHARRTLDAAGVTLTWEAPREGLPALTATEETVLSLSVREAVTNIVRHAEATACTMRLTTTSDGYYALLVEDDGHHVIQQEGNGLRGMRERVSGLGGRFSIRCDRGTHLLIELPITSQQGMPRMTPTPKHDAGSGLANNKIRVVLAEDQAMVLGALAALLEMEPDIAVVARAATGRAALDAVVRFNPDVLVTDIEMPQMTGLEVATALRSSQPGVRCIILTTFARPGYLRRALDAGACGYLLKDHPAAELADAVRRVHRGLRVVDPALATEAWSAELDPLTDRERQILQRAGDGRSSPEIASELRPSEGTVRNYLSEAIAKLGASNRVDAARIARAKGWL